MPSGTMLSSSLRCCKHGQYDINLNLKLEVIDLQCVYPAPTGLFPRSTVVQADLQCQQLLIRLY